MWDFWGNKVAAAVEPAYLSVFHFYSRNCHSITPIVTQTSASLWTTRWRSCLRHCATSRKVTGSIPDDVTGIFRWHNPSGRTACNRNEYQEYFLWGGGPQRRWCVVLTTLPPSCAECLEIWVPQTPGTVRAVMGLLYFYQVCTRGYHLVVQRANVYWSWRMKDQLDVTCYFISLLMCSTCFGH